MKKLFLIFILSFLLIGCNTANPGKSDEDILNEILQDISLPSEVDADLNLPTSYEKDGQIIMAAWSSNDIDYISNDGKILREDEDVFVTIDLELTLNDSKVSKSFEITILAYSKEEIANNILSLVDIDSEISNSIALPPYVVYNDSTYKLNWESSNPEILSNKGVLVYQPEDTKVTLTTTISYKKEKFSKNFDITVKAFDKDDMQEFIDKLSIPEDISSDLTLDTEYVKNDVTYSVTWKSSNESILSNQGTIGLVLTDSDINLTATIQIGDVSISKRFDITVLALPIDKIVDTVKDSIVIHPFINNDVNLNTDFGDFIECSWLSSNENAISNAGVVNKDLTKPTKVTLTAIFKIGEQMMTENYDTIIYPIKHFYKTDKFVGELDNVKLDSRGRLILEDNALTGTFISEEIDCASFFEAVASWSAITSKEATCELFVSARVNGKFSEYISYGEWGLGLQNKCVDQTNSLIKLSTDEIMVLNGKNADGIKYKLVLRRKNVSVSSPEVFLVTFAFNLSNYSYSLDKSLLKDSVLYDVPKLYQHDVPSIGNSICSATSSTMLLKYKGHNFSAIDPLEHQYIAWIVRDYGNNIFGNWVYNCVAMSAFDEVAYVKRFVDTYEFLYSLQEIGPMSASIKGTVKYTKQATGQTGSYTTGGHLIVVTGFEITDNETYIYINDPNVNGVAIKMTLADYLNVWRNVSYIIE